MNKVGIVDAINVASGTIRIILPDEDDAVIDEIALLKSEQWFPEIDEAVICVFSEGGQGFCLGSFFSEAEPNYEPDADLVIKKFDDDLIITYDKRSKSLSLHAANPITINGDVSVNGNLTVSGIIDGGGSS